MLEIFALPYFLLTGVIGWAIFAPFFRDQEFESFAFARVTISDLLAVSLPVGILFGSANWVLPANIQSVTVQAIVLSLGLAFALFALITGLLLVPKQFSVTFLKRMAVVGIIAPFGILLTIGWIGLLGWVCFYSILYLAPAILAVTAATFGLHMLSAWVCRADGAEGGRSESST